jgi:indole-3-glycerol phosphate synthase
MTATDAQQRSKRDQKTHERNVTRVQARINSERARREFAETLNALEDKLNVPKQVSRASARTKVKLRRFAKEQPAAAVAAATSVALAVGGAVFLIVRAVAKP